VNLHSVHLNLLVAFDALLEERSVTRAAARVGVTQPAMSNSLSQLRALFDDPLFRRQRHGLAPTPRALELGPAIRRGLSSLQAALEPPRFDPARDERTFILAASDYMEFVLVPPLLTALSRSAPGISLEVRPWGLHRVPEGLAENEFQFMLGFYDEVPPRHRHQILMEDEYVCVVRRDHPRVGRKLTLERYLELGHVLVSQRSDSPGSVDRALARRGQKRRIVTRVSHFLMVPMLIARTDLVAAISRRVAEPFAKPLGLRLLEPPVPLPRGRLGMVWHEQLDLDPAHRFLRETIAAVSKQL
jgi:DNA-binding transcriptional LysR family regulator